jgi:DNA-binding NarL/FixJ family response regulator
MTTSRRSIVLADDHPSVLQRAIEFLEPHFEIAAASQSGTEALDAIQRLNPDLAVLDISMPGLGGFDVAERLFAEGNPARVALMSAGLSDDVVAAGCAVGVRGFIAKTRMHTDLLSALLHMEEGRAFMPSVTAFAEAFATPLGRHALQISRTHGDRLTSATAYLLAAWKMGHVLLTVTSADDTEALRRSLEAAGVDTACAAACGRYAAVDAHAAIEGVMNDGDVDADRFTGMFGPLIEQLSADRGHGPRHVSTFGDLSAILWADGRLNAALSLEHLSNEFLIGRPLSILCACAVSGPDVPEDDVEARLSAAHPTIIASL